MVDRGPTVVPLAGDANGLFWDDATATLLIADNLNNRILKWTDGGGIAKVADLPAAPQNGPGLGQVVKTADGTIIVTRFGFGTAGDVVFVKSDGTTGKVPNLDPMKRRIGLTVAPDGTLYDGYFVKTATNYLGAAARLDLAGSETDVLTGFQKPVGVLAFGSLLYVSDQSAGTIVDSPLAMPGKLASLATIDSPDLMCAGPNGSLFTGGPMGAVRQIASDGTVTNFATGFQQARGVAYDAKNRRLFGADHDPAHVKDAIRILPVGG
jgi:sugar lactone lactonase YvrE